MRVLRGDLTNNAINPDRPPRGFARNGPLIRRKSAISFVVVFFDRCEDQRLIGHEDHGQVDSVRSMQERCRCGLDHFCFPAADTARGSNPENQAQGHYRQESQQKGRNGNRTMNLGPPTRTAVFDVTGRELLAGFVDKIHVGHG